MSTKKKIAILIVGVVLIGVGKYVYDMNIKHNFEVQIFPNPFHSFCEIRCDRCSDSHLNLYDITGRIVISMAYDRELNLNTSSLLSGIYVLELTDLDGFKMKSKLLKY